MNANDDCRDKILRFLMERHQTAKGITAIPIGIQDLRREMKARHRMKQSEVANHLEAGSVYKRPQAASQVNITNVQGVTVVGDGNIVNAKFTELVSALDALDQAIAASPSLRDEQKLDAAGDLSAIRAQVAKKNPTASVIRNAWEGLKALPVLGNAATALTNVSKLLGALLS